MLLTDAQNELLVFLESVSIQAGSREDYVKQLESKIEHLNALLRDKQTQTQASSPVSQEARFLFLLWHSFNDRKLRNFSGLIFPNEYEHLWLKIKNAR